LERIDPFGRSFHSPTSKSKKKAKSKESKRSSFSTLVDGERRTSAGEAVFAELGVDADTSLEEMLDAIHSVGERIRENASREAIDQYRTTVRAFMKYVLANALKLDVKSSSPNILRQKKFTLVKVIDQKLERLASDILTNQRDALETLARIDEINGLLVDLIS
jgi:uncharacterized protein